MKKSLVLRQCVRLCPTCEAMTPHNDAFIKRSERMMVAQLTVCQTCQDSRKITGPPDTEFCKRCNQETPSRNSFEKQGEIRCAKCGRLRWETASLRARVREMRWIQFVLRGEAEVPAE